MTPLAIIYLFLDFDGVLHPLFAGSAHQDWERKNFCYLPELENALRRIRQPLRIVITSTWRKQRDLAALRAPFSADIAPLVVGKTPDLSAGNHPGARLLEVQAWMKTHAPPGAWAIALDDVPELYLGPDGQTNAIAVISCPDRFGPEQARHLALACQDPEQWIHTHPIPLRTGLILPGPSRYEN